MKKKSDSDRYERLDYADRWLRAALEIVSPPGFFQSVEVDMSACRDTIETARERGEKLTYTHAFVRAAALALSDDEELHQLVVGNRRFIPGRVDIGLSVAGDSFVAPVLVMEDVSNKTLAQIATEVLEGAPRVRSEHEQFLASARRWGWLVPFAGLRRAILKRLVRRFSFIRSANGTFQISCLKDADLFVPLLFSTTAIMGTGQVRNRVLVVNGEATVRPTVLISCCADHGVWDGIRGARFLGKVKSALEAGKL